MPLTIAVACVFAQVALTFYAIIRMGLGRVGAVRAQNIPLARVATGSDFYPDEVKKLQANAQNQFETPPLLYGGVALGAALGAVNWGMALAAVVYLGTRLAHRAEHVGRNHVRVRFLIYVTGIVALIAMWVSLGIGLIL